MQRACRRAASALPRRRPEQRVRPVTAPAEQCAARYDEHLSCLNEVMSGVLSPARLGVNMTVYLTGAIIKQVLISREKSVRLNEARFEFHNPEV
jgi:hypothetical protein